MSSRLILQLSFVVLFGLHSISVQAQLGGLGGRDAFDAISLPTSARITALGGTQITIRDSDVTLAQLNPALADSVMHHQLSFNHNFHFADISNGNLAYGHYIKKWKILAHAALQYINYGSFDATDAFGNINGEFNANEVALVVGSSYRLNERIHGGVNVKFLFGNFESYRSSGIGVDIGLHYEKPDNRTSWGLVLRNIGTELQPLGNSRRSLPFDLQLGFSRRLQHLPFRFSVIGRHLHQPYIRYDDPEFDITVDIFGEQTFRNSFSKNIDNFFRHLVLSGEFLLGKRENFRLRFAYDHLRRQELRSSIFRSLGGFSFGFGISIKKIKIDYGVGHYHLAGAVNHIGLRYNVGNIFNKF